jgi:hypothetical protein
VDPYLAEHENDIDKALKDMQTQAMAMGMRYIKQAIQLIQNLVLDFVRKVGSLNNAKKKKKNASPGTLTSD